MSSQPSPPSTRWPDIFFKPRIAEKDLPSEEIAARRLPVTQINLPPGPVHPVTADTAVMQDMDEADTLRQLTKSGGIRLVKLDFPIPEDGTEATAPVAPTPEVPPPATTIPRRMTRIADVARIILPEPPSAVVPPSFPVNVPTGSVLSTEAAGTAEQPASSLPAPEPQPGDAALSAVREKREFILSNGERILGRILSETPESVYLEHETLGVLTIPRAQIAQRPVEIILVNGDRIVGDIIAESADSLFVRHASLGVLTVPRSQRSTRVVEAILKDGDRILGEVLGETENFTVIRSASLGTVTVPHSQVALLNRRAEEVRMKALPSPAAAPQLENRPDA